MKANKVMNAAESIPKKEKTHTPGDHLHKSHPSMIDFPAQVRRTKRRALINHYSVLVLIQMNNQLDPIVKTQQSMI